MTNTSDYMKILELSKRGHQLLKEKSYLEACALFEEARKLEPNNPYILVGIGDAQRGLNNFSKAAQCYQRVLDQDPENLFALRGLGDTRRDQDLIDEALVLWERYIQCRPRDIFVLTRIADGYKAIGKLQLAEECYQRALNIKKKDSHASDGTSRPVP